MKLLLLPTGELVVEGYFGTLSNKMFSSIQTHAVYDSGFDVGLGYGVVGDDVLC